jgi:hypothetical protein
MPKPEKVKVKSSANAPPALKAVVSTTPLIMAGRKKEAKDTFGRRENAEVSIRTIEKIKA